VTLAGCFGMIYAAGIASPAATDFFRSLGMNEFHFGLLGGLPMIMLFLQFVGALVTPRLRHRKGLFILFTLISRLLYIPVALMPLLCPGLSQGGWIFYTILIIAVSQAFANFSLPLWFSWMGDLVPTPLVNRFWSRRHLWVQSTWTAAYLGVAALAYFSGLPIRILYAVIVMGGCIAGIIDVLIYLQIQEPSPPPVQNRPLFAILRAPFEHPEYRTFVAFHCYWYVAVSFFVPFTQLYLLKKLGLSAWQATVLYCLYGIANLPTARLWGRLADRYGNRPVLTVCVWAKSLVVITFLLVTPALAIPVLAITFFFDGMLNSGFAIATNGYMFKMAPPSERSMFLAAITGLAGLCGCMASLVSGALLQKTEGFHLLFLGRDWNHYHLMFLISMLLRWGAVLFAHRIREPKSSSTREVFGYLLDLLPVQFIQVYFRKNSERKDV
jgi:MFS family permease